MFGLLGFSYLLLLTLQLLKRNCCKTEGTRLSSFTPSINSQLEPHPPNPLRQPRQTRHQDGEDRLWTETDDSKCAKPQATAFPTHEGHDVIKTHRLWARTGKVIGLQPAGATIRDRPGAHPTHPGCPAPGRRDDTGCWVPSSVHESASDPRTPCAASGWERLGPELATRRFLGQDHEC